MEISPRKLAVGAARLAALAHLGPVGGGLFVAGLAVGGKVLAGSEWADTLADMAMHLGSHAASEMFGSAVEGFRSGHDSDLDKSMRLAAKDALGRLKGEAPAGFEDWFKDWDEYLASVKEVYSGACDLDPITLSYDDAAFRRLWWGRMEGVLVVWRSGGKLDLKGEVPEPLAEFLRERLPEALLEAHAEVLRDEKLNRSWIAFQQGVFDEMRGGLGRIEGKLDRALGALPGPVWNIPRPGRHFQDRPDIVDQIDARLRKGATALTALHGLGGIGKTQMARGYAQQRRERYTLGVWIEAESAVSLVSSLSSLGGLLGLPAEQDQQALAMRVIHEVSQRSPYLVIFDNAESPEVLRPYIERLSGNGDVLITSRHQDWDGLADTVSVTHWSVEESVRFLLGRTERIDDAAARALAVEMDGLVLALEHAAAYMLAGDGMTLAEYRGVWREKLQWVAKGHDYPASVAAVLGLSLDAVAKESPVAYDLLCLFSWLAPDRIPRKELLEEGAEGLPDALRSAFANHDVWLEVISTLGRYSLLTREKADGVVTAYYMHRVVQQVVRGRQVGTQWLGVACDVVSEAFPVESDEPQFWAASEALLPHTRVIRGHVRGSEPRASLGRLLNQAGGYLRLRGLYAEARDFHDLALESALRQLGPDHPDVAVCRSNLAIVLYDLGEYAEARKQIELALASDLRQLGSGHPKVAIRRSNLASVLKDLGEHAEARKQIELALESGLRHFGPDHPSAAIDRSNLATILGELSLHAEARKQIELALESALRQFGPDHPTVATCRSNLANILRDLGEHEEARRQIDLALESNLRQFGPGHPDVATCRLILASVHYSLGEYETALVEIDQALDVLRRTLPPEHPRIRSAERTRTLILAKIHPNDSSL